MASFSASTPPPFDKNRDNYQKWKKKVGVWRSITDVDKKKQGGLIALRLDDDTQETILETVSEEDLAKDTGADSVINKLDGMFQIAETETTYQIYEAFEIHRRPQNLSINEYCQEFEKCKKQ